MLDVYQPFFFQLKGLYTPEPFESRRHTSHILMSKLSREMWELDSLGVRSSDNNQLNQEEILAVSNVEKSRRWIEGHYKVVILWEKEFSLSDCREEAERRLFSLKKKPPEEAKPMRALASGLNSRGPDGKIRVVRVRTDRRITFGQSQSCVHWN